MDQFSYAVKLNDISSEIELRLLMVSIGFIP